MDFFYNLLERYETLKKSVNSGVEPLDTIQLPTSTIKTLLGGMILNSLLASLWWSVKDNSYIPWIFFVGSFLQVGWFWSKVTKSWKIARGMYMPVSTNDSLSATNTTINASAMDINNTGIVQHV